MKIQCTLCNHPVELIKTWSENYGSILVVEVSCLRCANKLAHKYTLYTGIQVRQAWKI